MKGNELSTLIELIRKYNKTGDLSMVERRIILLSKSMTGRQENPASLLLTTRFKSLQ